MRQLVRRNLGFFLLATAAAFALRLIFLWKLSFVAGDSLIYGDIAKNWLHYGKFAMTEDGAPVLTCIRLPGYPAFVAAIWKIVGLEHYRAVMLAQVFVDAGTCYLVAMLARLVLWDRAAMAAFLLYALNPFTPNYAATPMPETLAIFFSGLVLLLAVEGLQSDAGLQAWVYCGLATAAGIFVRPDDGLLLAGIGGYLVIQWVSQRSRRFVVAAVVLAAVSLAPLVPWTIRNWRAFHRFEPLAPRYANNPWEYVPAGFNRWIRTWLVDYVSVEDIYWHVPGDTIDIGKLPPRAFDSPQQRAETRQIFVEYNSSCDPICHVAPELDARFSRLADERIRDHPLRYYLWLPLLRVADMLLRPRTEALPIDPHWWRFRADRRDSSIGILLGAIGLAYVVAALSGALKRQVAYAGLFILWIALRCAFLATLENPETRYTLECFPAIMVFAAANTPPHPQDSET